MLAGDSPEPGTEPSFCAAWGSLKHGASTKGMLHWQSREELNAAIGSPAASTHNVFYTQTRACTVITDKSMPDATEQL